VTENEFRGARLLAALSNVIRFRIVLLLDKRCLTPRQLAARLRRTVPRISHHLAVLRATDVVRFKVADGEHFYWLKEPEAARLCQRAVEIGKRMRAVSS